MNTEDAARKLHTLPWQALFNLALEHQIEEDEIKKCFFRSNDPGNIYHNLDILGRGIEDGMLYSLRDRGFLSVCGFVVCLSVLTGHHYMQNAYKDDPS